MAAKKKQHPFAPKDETERQERLNAVQSEINKKFGAGTIDTAANKAPGLIITPLPTPSLKLNAILEGGFMEGRMVELFGPESSGKTFLTYEVIATDMKRHPNSVWLWCETEGSFNPNDAAMMGVDLNRLQFVPLGDKGAEELLDIMEAYIRQLSADKGLLRGVVVNSVAGLTPIDELNALHGKQHMGLHARMMSKHMRKINAISHKTRTTIIYINQIRDKISLFGGTTTTGGRALKFYASQRIEVRRASETNANWDILRMMKIDIKVHKNRLAKGNPYRSTSIYAVYGSGIDAGIEIAELAVTAGLIQKGGAWYTYNRVTKEPIGLAEGEKPNKKTQYQDKVEVLKFNGNVKLLEFLNANPDIKQELYDAIYDSFIITTDMSVAEQQAIQQIDVIDIAEFSNIEHEEAVEADAMPIDNS